MTDKEATYKWLEEMGLSDYLPAYYAFDTQDELRELADNKFQQEDELVVKDASGHGSTGFALLTHHEKFIEAIEKQQSRVFALDDYLKTDNTERRMVMKNLDQPEFSVDLYVHNCKNRHQRSPQRTGCIQRSGPGRDGHRTHRSHSHVIGNCGSAH
ncbi:MAG: hypothetical protein U5K84_07220 [Alkalibacterium sp.]|nr:hypothetical protein [Alkalibacterium sp.]